MVTTMTCLAFAAAQPNESHHRNFYPEARSEGRQAPKDSPSGKQAFVLITAFLCIDNLRQIQHRFGQGRADSLLVCERIAGFKDSINSAQYCRHLERFFVRERKQNKKRELLRHRLAQVLH